MAIVVAGGAGMVIGGYSRPKLFASLMLISTVEPMGRSMGRRGHWCSAILCLLLTVRQVHRT